MNVYKPCSEDVPTKSYELGPKRCRGIIPLPGNWIMRSIAAAWLVSFMAFIFLGVGPFSLYLFSLKSQTCSRGWIFYEKSCGPSTYVVALDEPDSIGPRVSGYLKPVVPVVFLIDSFDFMENQPVCHIYQWVAHPTPGGVCNHCGRMMDGLRLDDVIAGNREGSLTEDEIVEYVQNGDPNHRDWDEWPLRMTFRINSFLRAQGPVGEPDLAALGFLDD